MNRYGSMAEEHWRHHLPDGYSRLSDKDEFFTALGDDALSQIEDLEERLRGDDPVDEAFAHKMARYARARQTAEEIVFREVIFIAPTPPEPDDDEAEEDTGFEDAIADFYAAREELYDHLDAERDRREQSQEPG